MSRTVGMINRSSRSIDHNPGFAVLAEALDRHIGPAAGALMRAPFGLGDEEALLGLVGGAGFQDVRVDRKAGVVRFGSAQELVVAYGAGSPLASPIGGAGPAARAGLVAEVQAAPDPWQGAAGWPSRSRRCWSAAAGRRGRGRLLGCMAGWRGIWSACRNRPASWLVAVGSAMAYNFLACDRDQAFLLPPDVRDWLPADHLAWFILDVVDQLDLDPFLPAYRADGHGRAAYQPRMLLAVLLYGYCTGVRSSRQIERRCREDIAFRVLAGNRIPDHVTIARFRVRHEQALAGLLVASLKLCAAAGMVRLGLLALDGTKIEANAAAAAQPHPCHAQGAGR